MTKISDAEVIRKWQHLEQSARKRGIEFDLSFIAVKNMLRSKKCHYTGIPFGAEKGSERTVDRVDPRKGYVHGNVVTCCMAFNKLKNEVEHLGKDGIGEMVKALNKVYKRM